LRRTAVRSTERLKIGEIARTSGEGLIA